MDFSEDIIEAGKVPALVSYASMITGWPLFLWPLVTRDNGYALEHGKWAGAIWAGSFVTAIAVMFIGIITCGIGYILFPLILAWWIPAIMGVMGVLNGKCEPPPIAGAMADMMFKSIELKIEGE